MVSSGVNSELTSVAPYRLMTHFGLALLIICYCFWLWLELGAVEARDAARRRSAGRPRMIWISALQMALGALVAGLDAGRGYTGLAADVGPCRAGRDVVDGARSG